MADDCPKCEDGLPPWMATFADLMSLLMCFFVLLLSFATIDAVRFKKMAESMKDAFGVQREIPANEIVMGVSVIKQEWSPTVAEQSVITEIRQETSEARKNISRCRMREAAGTATADSAAANQQEIDRRGGHEAAEETLQKELDEQLASCRTRLTRRSSRVW